MLELKNHKIAIPVVLFAGLLWSFGPLVVRYMNEPNLVPCGLLYTSPSRRDVEESRMPSSA